MWANTAYRSKANEAHLSARGLRSRIHRKKPPGKSPGKPMPKNVCRSTSPAPTTPRKVRAAVEHVFARQKGPMALVVCIIGLARATVKSGLANLVYTMNRAVWLTGSQAGTA